MIRRIDRAWASGHLDASWPKQTPGHGRRVLASIASSWCGGDERAASWVLADGWARERTVRWGRALLQAGPIPAVTGTGWLTVLVFAVVVYVTRTRLSWGCEFNIAMPGRDRLRLRMIERFRWQLPAFVLLVDDLSRVSLLRGVDERTSETVLILAPEWAGTVGELIEVARELTH